MDDLRELIQIDPREQLAEPLTPEDNDPDNLPF